MPLGIHEIFKIIIKKNLCLPPLSTTVWCTFAKRKTPRTQSWPAPPSAAAYPCIDCTVAHIEDDIILKELQVPTNYVKLQILKRGTQSFSFDLIMVPISWHLPWLFSYYMYWGSCSHHSGALQEICTIVEVFLRWVQKPWLYVAYYGIFWDYHYRYSFLQHPTAARHKTAAIYMF